MKRHHAAFSLKEQLLNATTSCVFLSNALVVCMEMEPFFSASILSLCATLPPEDNQIFISRDVRDEKAARKYKNNESRFRKLHQRRLQSLLI